MATATRVKPPAPAYDTSDVILTLTSDEAIAIRTLVGSVAGCGIFRETTDRVWAALTKEGIRTLRLDTCLNIKKEINEALRPGFFHDSTRVQTP